MTRWISPERPRRKHAVPAIVFLVVLTGTPVRGDLTMGRLTSWPIVIPAEAAPAERHAAAELRDLITQATGVRMEIATAGGRHDSGVFLGKASGLKVSDLGEEAFRTRITDRRVEIAGGGPRGTLYGVYTFLEDHLGVRFLTPDATHVPHAGPDQVLPTGERVFRPRFAWRDSYYEANRARPEFAARLRNNAVTDRAELGGRSSWSLISHSVHEYVPVARFGKDHPDYFSLVDGKRRSFMHDDQFEQGGTQPCFTSPGVRRLIIDGILGRLAAQGQTSGNIAISQNDNTMYCRCERCAAIDAREESHMGALLTLVNEAADAVAKARPGVFVGTLAYQFSRKPPRFMRPHSNVAIQLCSIEACQIHPLDDPDCSLNTAFRKDLEGWCEICKNVYVWNYNVSFTCYNTPCPNLRVIGPNVRFLAAHGVNGVFMQAAGNGRNTELCELRNYLISRLLWDPAADDRRLIDEFVTLYYGRAAEKVRASIELIHDAARNSGIHHGCFGTAASYGIGAAAARKALDLLNEGMAAAENDEIRRRVEKATIGPLTALTEPFARWVARHHGEIASGSAGQVPAEVYRGIESELRQVFRLYERHGVDRYAEWLTVPQVKALLPAALLTAG